jgi:hypothetical protein
MKRKNPPFVHGYVDQHGTAKFYLRRAGQPKIKLPGLPWSPEFMAAHEAAMSGQWTKPEAGASRTVPGTVNAALVSYYQSSAFRDGLAQSSQQNRRAILERFREEHGEKRIALLHKKAMQAILNKKSPAAASNWRKALRGFIDHAMSLDMLTIDPRGHQAGFDQVGRAPPLGVGRVRQVRSAPRDRNARQVGIRVAVAGWTITLRRRAHGAPACSQRHHVAAEAKDRRRIRRAYDASAASGDRCHAGERASDLPCDGLRQAVHGRGFRQLVSRSLQRGWIAEAVHLARTAQGGGYAAR